MLEILLVGKNKTKHDGGIVLSLSPSASSRQLPITTEWAGGVALYHPGGTSQVWTGNATGASTGSLIVPANTTSVTLRFNPLGNSTQSRLVISGNAFVTAVVDWSQCTLAAVHFSGNSALVSVPEYLPKSITNAAAMFSDCGSFNSTNVSNWDTSNITQMFEMFYNCTNFNQPLNNWDVRKIVSFSFMFGGCANFNQPLDSWVLTAAKDLSYMFFNCARFNGALNNMKPNNVTNMNFMFYGCANFNQPLNLWNTANVTTINQMFRMASKFNQDLSSWNTAKITARDSYDLQATVWQAINKPRFA